MMGKPPSRWFAWKPVPLSMYRKPYWARTGKTAWLRTVMRRVTAWGDVIYEEVRE